MCKCRHFFSLMYYQLLINPEWKCIQLTVLRMIISECCTPSKQERLDPAVQPFDTTLNSGRETSVKKKTKKPPWNPPDVRVRRAQRKNWSDKRKDCTGDMCLWRGRRLGSHSKTSNQERCLFSHACPCSQQSLSSQQLFQWGRWALPTLHLWAVNKLCWGGLDDVCVRNKIILKPILMVPLHLLWVLSQQILTGVKLCHHWRQVSRLLEMYAASGCIGPIFRLSHQRCGLRSTCSDNEFWQIQIFLCSHKSRLKIPNWHFQELIDGGSNLHMNPLHVM